MATEVFGVLAVASMVTMYALEQRSPVFVLGFAVSCAAAALYAMLIHSWPFAAVEGVWTVIALRRWMRVRARRTSEGRVGGGIRMPGRRITRGGWLAIALAVVGSLVAVVNEVIDYRRSGVVDWGHVVLAIGVPILMYAIVRAASTRQG